MRLRSVLLAISLGVACHPKPEDPMIREVAPAVFVGVRARLASGESCPQNAGELVPKYIVKLPNDQYAEDFTVSCVGERIEVYYRGRKVDGGSRLPTNNGQQ